MLHDLFDAVTAEGATVFTSWGQFAAACGFLLLAETIYVLFGFGSGLVAIGTLALIFPELKDAVVLILLVNLIPEAWVIYSTWRKIAWKGVLLICVGIAVGVPTGTWILQAMDAVILLTGLGIFLVLTGAGFLATPAGQRVAWPNWAVPIIGTVSGLLGGMFGTGGPPLIIYYQLGGVDKATFRGNLMAIFFIVTVVRLVSYGVSGLLTPPRLVSAVIVLPAIFVGIWIGNSIELKIPERSFQRLVAVALVVMGGLLLARGLV